MIALTSLAPGATLSARPAYAVEVVRYYLPPAERERAQRKGNPAVMLLEDRAASATQHLGTASGFSGNNRTTARCRCPQAMI